MSSQTLLIDEVFRCVDAIGYQNTLDTIRKAQYQEIKFDDARVERVVTTVSEKMNVPVHEILFGSGRKNERKYAIGFCAHYLHNEEFFNIDMDTVKNWLHKSHPVNCYVYSRMITKLNPNHAADRPFYEIKKELDVLFAKTNNKK